MRQTLPKLAIIALAFTGAAQAATVGDAGIPYAGVGGLYEFGDSARNSDDGKGFQLQFGWPLDAYGYRHWAAEATVHSLQRSRDVDGGDDYQTGLLFDLVYDFGLFGWGDSASGGPRFKPFALAGLGIVHEDVGGDTHEHFGMNVGAGALVPLGWHDWALRIEGRALAQDNDRSVPGENVLIDYRVTAGLQIPLSFLFSPTTHELPPEPQDCELAVVDPVTGRTDCGVDSDRDGVLDGQDLCPGTPAGESVDGRGCAVTVEAQPVAAAVAPPDADGDGVDDSADRCSGTPAGASVDAQGCIVGQTLVLPGIQFEPDTAILDVASRKVLDDLAASLRAQPGLRLEIGGHTDNLGNKAYNLMLSQQRAEAVRQYLIGRGIDPDRLVAQGYGEFRPIADNQTDEGRAENRRVEFRIIIE